MMKSLLLAFVLLCVSPLSFSQQQNVDTKYDGIEITVNINQASAQELADLLKGIGLKKAQAIIDYRQLNGDFASADALTAIKGIGPSIVEKNRDRIEL